MTLSARCMTFLLSLTLSITYLFSSISIFYFDQYHDIKCKCWSVIHNTHQFKMRLVRTHRREVFVVIIYTRKNVFLLLYIYIFGINKFDLILFVTGSWCKEKTVNFSIVFWQKNTIKWKEEIFFLNLISINHNLRSNNES